MTWNFDMSSAPRGRHVTQTRIIKGEPQQFDVFIMERVLLAHPTDGKVYATYWIEPNKFTPNGRWSGWSEGVEPLAWMPYPVHPFAAASQGEAAVPSTENVNPRDSGGSGANEGGEDVDRSAMRAGLCGTQNLEPTGPVAERATHFILDDCGSGA